MDFEALVQTIFLFLVLMVPGYHLGKWKELPDEALPGIGSILMYIAMPAQQYAPTVSSKKELNTLKTDT